MRANCCLVWLFGLLMYGASVSADSSVNGASEERLDPARSLVVFDYPVDPHSATRSAYPMVILADAAAPKGAQDSRLEIGRKTGLQVLEVSAGSYYIRQVESDFYGFQSAPRAVPTDAGELLTIPPGVVAYLGNIRWTTDMGLRMNYSKDGLLELQKISRLHKWPLVLIGFGANPQPVSWD